MAFKITSKIVFQVKRDIAIYVVGLHHGLDLIEFFVLNLIMSDLPILC